MKNNNERETLDQLLDSVRRRIFLKTAGATVVRTGIIVLPVAAAAIAANQRWGDARWSAVVVAVSLAILVVYPVLKGFFGLGARLKSALAVDEQARLKDRVASAYEFLSEGNLDEPRAIQVHDAIRQIEKINSSHLFRFQWPRHSILLPVVAAVFLASFFVPPAIGLKPANAAVDQTKQLQLEELKELEQQLAFEIQNEELEQVLEKLKEIRDRFEQGDLSERDVMLELARLDENLRQKANELGVENLEGEMNVIVPQMMSAAAAIEFAAALKENQLDKAAQELQQISEKLKNDNLSPEEKRQLAMAMGVCASKIGSKKQASFGGNFSQASQALEKSDSEGFESACQSIGDKLKLMSQCRSMNAACKKIGLCKSSLGQCNSKEGGYALGPKTQSKGKGGLKAGTGASGDPLGEASRLADSYRTMLRVTGQAGDGPVESETEVTEGQISDSQLAVKEVHANYAAVAEEAIENEAIPLSHRYHVKRYFQSIRPQE